jgi:anti-sigma regulatory factor (Ser/Thr protein kinase)
MSHDGPLGEPAGPAGQPGQAGSTFSTTEGGVPPVLDLAFDSGTLHVLRTEVRARARQAGLSEDRAGDVVVAVHELAANAISHGRGKGRLRVWDLAGALHCQVDDGDLDASRDPAAALNSLPYLPGHGLWVARQVADHMQTLSGPHGTRVTLTFVPPATD